MGTSYFRKWPNGTQLIEEIDPDAPITVGYIALKSCVNILYFILSRIDEDPINENDDVIDITNSR